MGKVQTRRSISIKGITYQRLKDYCDEHDLSCSGFIEELIAERLEENAANELSQLKEIAEEMSTCITDNRLEGEALTAYILGIMLVDMRRG